MNIIRTENLTYVYNKNTPFELTAISNINLSIKQRSFVGIIGKTGSGKSTLIQHFNGLLKPTFGKVFLDGEDIWSMGKSKRDVKFKVGLVFQYPEYQLFEQTVYEDIAFGPKNMGENAEQIKQRVLEAIEFVEISKLALNKSPFEFSGGEKRKIAIAGVVAMKPKVLILDEPTAGLDPKGKKNILDKLKKYQKEKQNTVILVSHSMDDIAKYADEIIVINDSNVFLQGEVNEIFSEIEKISEIGLAIPQIAKVFLELKHMGYNVNTNIYTIEQAEEEFLRLANNKEKK